MDDFEFLVLARGTKMAWVAPGRSASGAPEPPRLAECVWASERMAVLRATEMLIIANLEQHCFLTVTHLITHSNYPICARLRRKKVPRAYPTLLPRARFARRAAKLPPHNYS